MVLLGTEQQLGYVRCIRNCMDGGNPIPIWRQKLYVYVALAHLEPDFYNDVSGGLDQTLKYYDRIRMDPDAFW